MPRGLNVHGIARAAPASVASPKSPERSEVASSVHFHHHSPVKVHKQPLFRATSWRRRGSAKLKLKHNNNKAARGRFRSARFTLFNRTRFFKKYIGERHKTNSRAFLVLKYNGFCSCSNGALWRALSSHTARNQTWPPPPAAAVPPTTSNQTHGQSQALHTATVYISESYARRC